MGIPSYFSYIVKNHSKIIKKISKDFKINNLYLDCNSIIYDVIHNIDFSKLDDTDINVIIRNVIKKIDEYIDILSPDENVFIAFDGVAPVAKLEQQRNRRYKSQYQNKIIKTIFKNSKPDPWNTTAITPGTNFMEKLNHKIKHYYNDPNKYNLKAIILSLSDRVGEGEHKIFEFIRKYPEYHNNNINVIYGLDADLIMLSINHLPISNNIYLFRETPDYIKSINSDLEPNSNYIIDIPELANAITSKMYIMEPNKNIENTKHTEISQSIENLQVNKKINTIHDYIFMCFFLGNDFMPHFPSVNIRTGGIDKMLNAYYLTIKNGSENLIIDNKICWKNVRKLVEFLAISEENNFKNETKLRDKQEKMFQPNITPEEKIKKFESIPIYERHLEKYINPYKYGWQNRYYKALFNVEIDEERKRQICINYLEGLEWTYKYYTSGCPDWKWCYKYKYPPLLEDLIHFIPFFEKEFITKNNNKSVNELVQLSYVLPKECLHFLPEKLHNAIINLRPEWHKDDCEFIWAYCKYFWECHVELPEINIDELEQFVKNNS